MNKGVAWSGTIILSVVLAGCGTASKAGTSANSENKPVYGGSAVIALPAQSPPNWFFPLLSLTADTAVNSEADSLSYLPLLYFNKHDEFDSQHALAKSISWNKAGTVYTIRLNPKWHWSNGHPVTAQDVVFTYDLMRAASLNNTHYAWTFGGQGFGGLPSLWKSVVAHGTDTVVITINHPMNQQWFIRNGINQIIPVPQSVWDKHPHNMAAELAYISSVANSPSNPSYQVVDGPWKFSREVPNAYWLYVPNTRYSGHKAYLSKLVLQYESSSASEFAALKSGTVTYGYLPPSLIKDSKELTHNVFQPEYSLAFNYIQINMSPKAPNHMGQAFSELPVRQALQLGVDQTGIIDSLYHGYGVMDDTTLASKPQTPFLNPALTHNPYAFNVKRGKELLLKDGWHEVNGVMTKRNMKLEFTLYGASGSASYTAIDELLQQNWAKEGIVCNLEFQPFNTVVSYSVSDASKWAVINWNGGWGYPSGFPSGGGLFETGGAENSGDYSSKTMNKLVEATYLPGTTKQTLQRMYAFEDFAAKELPSVIFLPEFPQLTVHVANLHNSARTFNPIGAEIFPNEWWISPSTS